MSLYSSIVEINHEMKTEEKKLEALKLENAELENKIYTMLDTNILEKKRQELGLIIEKQPRYFETTQASLATHL